MALVAASNATMEEDTGEEDPVAPLIAAANRVLARGHVKLDGFELAALAFAAALLLCPLFRLGAWLAEQHHKAQREITIAEKVAEALDKLGHAPAIVHRDIDK